MMFAHSPFRLALNCLSRAPFFRLAHLCLVGCTTAFLPALEIAQAEPVQQSPSSADVSEYSLDAALKRALAENFQVAEAQKELEKQESLVTNIRGKLLPQLGATGAYNKTDTGLIPSVGGRSFGNATTWNGGVELSQSLYSGGSGINALHKQQLLADAAELGVRAIKQSVTYQTKKAFFDVLLARRTIDVQEQLVRLREETLSSEKNKFEAGTISNFEVLRAEVALANSQTPLIQSKNSLNLAEEELKRVLALSDDKIAVTGNLERESLPVATIDEARAIALKNRPDLEQVTLLVKAQERGVRVQLAEYLPKITAYSNYTYRNNPFGGAGTLDGWQVGVRGTWNLFDSFSREGAVNAAKADQHLAEIDRERLTQEIAIEVSQAMLSWAEAQQLLAASQQVVTQAAESERLARARLEVGAATQLDVLDSQVQLTEARTNEIKALHKLNLTKAAIERAVGGFEVTSRR